MQEFNPDKMFMQMALQQACRAAEQEEVPVGAVIVKDGELIGRAYNQTRLLKDPTAHAEMIAITQAANAVKDWRLNGCTLYVTKEPCPMCAGAIVLGRLSRVVWAVDDPQRGGALSRFQILDCKELNHRPECVTGVMEHECKELLQSFFRERRSSPGE